MKEFRGTPGEWRLDKWGAIVTEDGGVVADVEHSSFPSCQDENIRLMAASKDLLEALQAIMNQPSVPAGNGWEEYTLDSETIRDAFAAIRKALGE